jgi:hypothetical protein
MHSPKKSHQNLLITNTSKSNGNLMNLGSTLHLQLSQALDKVVCSCDPDSRILKTSEVSGNCSSCGLFYLVGVSY